MMKGKMCVIHWIAWVLVIIGALNWGLVGIFQFNLVSWIFHTLPLIERIIYILVGLSALVMLFHKSCKACSPAS